MDHSGDCFGDAQCRARDNRVHLDIAGAQCSPNSRGFAKSAASQRTIDIAARSRTGTGLGMTQD
jgi:hypothetical protein